MRETYVEDKGLLYLWMLKAFNANSADTDQRSPIRYFWYGNIMIHIYFMHALYLDVPSFQLVMKAGYLN